MLITVSLLAGLCRAQTFTTSHFAPFCVLVYASSVLLWLPPFPVVPPRLSYHYGIGFYAFHVSYMRCLCTKERRTGRQMILSGVRHGVTKECMKFCAGVRVNKRSRITLDRIRKVLARKQWPR